MIYITAKTGAGLLYIDRNLLKAIIIKPGIQKVPEASSDILGVSFFEKQLVVYYNLGGRTESACGIILDSGEKILTGIAAESAGEEEEDPQLLTPVMPGIWEKKID